MRRALGLDRSPAPRPNGTRSGDAPSPGRHRHRFVSDGEVPVVMVQSRPDQPGSNRLDAANAAALKDERAARERAERSLQAAQATIRDLQTKLAHATLARDEVAAALRACQEQLAAARTQFPAEAEPSPVRRRGRPPKAASAQTAAKPRERVQKPVKWWVKGWREKQGG